MRLRVKSIDEVLEGARLVLNDRGQPTFKESDPAYVVDKIGDLYEIYAQEATPAVTGFDITRVVTAEQLKYNLFRGILGSYRMLLSTDRRGYIGKSGARFCLLSRIGFPLEEGHFIFKDEQGEIHAGMGAEIRKYVQK